MTEEDKKALYDSVHKLVDACSALAEAFEAAVEAALEAIQTVAGEIAEAIPAIIDVCVEALIKDRSREASRRRREPRAAKPRQPFRKRQRIFRCRNNC